MLWVSFLSAVFVYITFSVFYMEFFFLVIFSSFFNQDSNPLSLIWSCICLGQCYDLPFYLHYSVFHKNFAKILKNHWIYQYCPSWFLLLLSCLRNSFLYSVHKDVVLYFHLFFGGTIFKVFIEFIGILFLFYLSVFWPQGTWGLSSLTRESNLHPSCWKVKSLQLDHQGSPSSLLPDLAEWILIHPVRFGLMPVVSLWRHIGWTTPMINLTFFFSIKKDAQPNVHSSRFIRPMRSIETQHVCVLLPNFLSTTRM